LRSFGPADAARHCDPIGFASASCGTEGEPGQGQGLLLAEGGHMDLRDRHTVAGLMGQRSCRQSIICQDPLENDRKLGVEPELQHRAAARRT
jgi:hypothetical protein